MKADRAASRALLNTAKAALFWGEERRGLFSVISNGVYLCLRDYL